MDWEVADFFSPAGAARLNGVIPANWKDFCDATKDPVVTRVFCITQLRPRNGKNELRFSIIALHCARKKIEPSANYRGYL